MARPFHPPGTRVALYLRRSHDKHQEESIETQRRGAIEYCKTRGWVIVEEFVDGLDRRASRAEFQKRPELIRMLNHAKTKSFEMVVMRDESRLGGDMQRTGLIMQDMIDVGVGIVYYISDELVEMEDAVDKFLVAARNFASELEREKISSRVHERLVQKAKAGKPPGALSYGYASGDDCYVVKDDEAAIVRRIFAEYRSGLGFRAICYKLNQEGIATPRGNTWQPSTTRGILTNPRYIGEARYNQTRHVYRGGTKVKERRPEAEHVTYACPAIVDRRAWDAVQKRLAKNIPFGGRSPNPKGAQPKYLLTGISRCSACSGPITAKKRKGSSPARAYQCGWHKERGPKVCTCSRTEACEQVDARVLAKVRELITQDIVAEVVQEVYAIHAERRAAAPAERERLQGTVDTLKREIERLTHALATLDSPPPSLLQALTDRDQRLRQAELALSATDAKAETIDETLAGIELYARRKLEELGAQLGHPATARAALVALTGGEKLTFEALPGGRFRVTGYVNLADLVAPPGSVLCQNSSEFRHGQGRLAFAA